MKKIISFFILFSFLLGVCSLFCSAGNETINDIEYFEDGSYAITSIIINHSFLSTSNSITRTKKYEFYDNTNQLCWAAFLTASFTYNGTTSSCTIVSKSTTIYNSSWRCTASSCNKSGATATGNYTFKRYVTLIPVQTVNKTLTLTCDKNGNIT